MKKFVWLRQRIFLTRPHKSRGRLLCDLKRRYPHCAARALDRRREANADEGAVRGWVQDRRHDADHLTVHRDQRAAGISGVGGGIELDQSGHDLLAFGRAETAVETRDNAGRDRWTNAKWVADSDHLVTGPEVGGRSKRRRFEVVGHLARLDDRKIVLRIDTHEIHVRLAAVEELHCDAPGA